MQWINRIGLAKLALARATRAHTRAQLALRNSGNTCAGAACAMAQAAADIEKYKRELREAQLLFLCE